MRLVNSKWESALFNNRLQLIQLGLGASAANSALWKVNYEYGELAQNGVDVETEKNTGNIARQTLTVPGTNFVQAYRYDPLYRIKEAKETTGANQNWIQNWTYDRYGNRLTFTQNIGGITTAPNPAVENLTNRFSSGQGFGYDKNGNVVNDVDALTNHGRQFKFNGDNKQIEVKDTSTNEIKGTYFYDGEGKRVKKVTSTETTVFVYSAGKLVEEYSTQLVTEPGINYTTTDHLGTPRVITDRHGNVKSRRDFLPFGEDIFANVGGRTSSLNYGATADEVRQKFTGYQKDTETSLDFAEARMYENRFGRFTAVDPLLASGKSANPQTFNRYVYVGNNPIIVTDPLGLDWFKKFNKEKNLWEYNERGGEGWDPVTYNESGYFTVNNWCWEGECGSGNATAYLYQSGGWDLGERANYGLTNAIADTGTSVAQFGWNSAAWINNGFWWAVSRPSPFAYNGSTTPAPNQIPYWEAENQVQANGQLAMTGITLYLGAAASARPRPVGFAGFTTPRTAGVGTAPVVQFEQYALRAAQDGMYPVMQRGFKDPVGSVFLKEGDVWKFGQTINGEGRYSGAFYRNTGAGLRFDSQFQTSSSKAALQRELDEILKFERQFGKLPPGNKIRR
jgi:RHS repeat-associated protein